MPEMHDLEYTTTNVGREPLVPSANEHRLETGWRGSTEPPFPQVATPDINPRIRPQTPSPSYPSGPMP